MRSAACRVQRRGLMKHPYRVQGHDLKPRRQKGQYQARCHCLGLMPRRGSVNGRAVHALPRTHPDVTQHQREVRLWTLLRGDRVPVSPSRNRRSVARPSLRSLRCLTADNHSGDALAEHPLPPLQQTQIKPPCNLYDQATNSTNPPRPSAPCATSVAL